MVPYHTYKDSIEEIEFSEPTVNQPAATNTLIIYDHYHLLYTGLETMSCLFCFSGDKLSPEERKGKYGDVW